MIKVEYFNEILKLINENMFIKKCDTKVICLSIIKKVINTKVLFPFLVINTKKRNRKRNPYP